MTALAAQNVGLQAAPLAFMVALGVSVAANVRVGNLLGAARPDEARRAAAVALCAGSCIALVLAAALLLLRGFISRAFSDDAAVVVRPPGGVSSADSFCAARRRLSTYDAFGVFLALPVPNKIGVYRSASSRNVARTTPNVLQSL